MTNNTRVTYADLFNATHKPIPIILKNTTDDNKKTMGKIMKATESVFTNGQIVDGELNEKYADEEFDIETLRQAFQKQGFGSDTYPIIRIQSYCKHFLVIKDNPEQEAKNHAIKQKATPALDKLFIALDH